MVIILIIAVVLIWCIGYALSGIIPFSAPISSFAYGNHAYCFVIPLILLDIMLVSLVCQTQDTLLKILGVVALIFSGFLALDKAHEFSALMLVVVLALYGIRSAVLAGDVVQLGLSALTVFVAPIMITQSAVEVTIAECTTVTCIGLFLWLHSRRIVLLPAKWIKTLGKGKDIDLKRLFTLGALWYLVAFAVFVGHQIECLQWFNLMIINVCAVGGAIYAYKKRRIMVATGIILGITYGLPVGVLLWFETLRLSAGGPYIMVVALIIMLVITYIFDEYID